MGGGGGGGGGPTYEPDECLLLNMKAVLNSPKVDVLQSIKVGDVLDVHLSSGDPIAVTVLHQGQPAGAITGPQFVKLINCMQNGHQYQAKVVSIQGGKCEVQVSYGNR